MRFDGTVYGVQQAYHDTVHELGRDGEEVRLEGRETHLPKDEGKVVLWR